MPKNLKPRGWRSNSPGNIGRSLNADFISHFPKNAPFPSFAISCIASSNDMYCTAVSLVSMNEFTEFNFGKQRWIISSLLYEGTINLALSVCSSRMSFCLWISGYQIGLTNKRVRVRVRIKGNICALRHQLV